MSNEQPQRQAAMTPADLTIAEIRRDVQDMTRDITSLTKIIRDGNGHPPLIVRVALLERKIDDLGVVLTEVRKALETRTTEETRGKWHLLSVIITGLLALVSAVVSAVLVLKK